MIRDIHNAIQKHQLYICFDLEEYDHYDKSWPDILSKEAAYDFNLDGKLELLRIRYLSGTKDKSEGVESKDTIVEITLGNKKILFKTRPEDYATFVVGVCDVDLADDFVEIYTTEYENCYGSSMLFRLNKNCLEKAMDLNYEEIVEVSGDGKIYVWNGCYRFPSYEETYADFVIWYFDYKNGMSVSSNYMIGKPDHASYGDILFIDREFASWGPSVEMTMELEGAFYEPERGEILTVIEKDEEL